MISHAVETKVSVNPMSTEEIQKYIESKEPMDKAGAYGIQGRFSAFIEEDRRGLFQCRRTSCFLRISGVKRTGGGIRCEAEKQRQTAKAA